MFHVKHSAEFFRFFSVSPLFALLETASRVDARHEIILPVHKPVRAKFKEVFFTISRLCALIMLFLSDFGTNHRIY